MDTIWGAGVLVGARLLAKTPQANAAGRSSARGQLSEGTGGYFASIPQATP